MFIKLMEQEEIKEVLEIDIELVFFQDFLVKLVVLEFSRGDDFRKGQMRLVIFIMVLFFYGVFEGMILGLQSMESNVWVLCFVIIIYWGILVFGMGLEYMRNEVKYCIMIFSVFLFFFLVVVGIIIGIVILIGVQFYEDVLFFDVIL